MSGLPCYIELYHSGELSERVKLLRNHLSACDICPRCCSVDRLSGESGYCRSEKHALVCSSCAHLGEESPLSGSRGSGTIFFGNCNLKCVFCQNADISQNISPINDYKFSSQALARTMIYLQEQKKTHNINFVSPTHFVPQIIEAINLAVPLGLRIPLVFNSNAYDSLTIIKLLDGIFDIYLPDLKYAEASASAKYSAVRDYPEKAKKAITEMYRQVGQLHTDSAGVARSGLIIRHLVLPNSIAGSIACLQWIAAELSPAVTVSLMAQYHPTNFAPRIPLLSRPLREGEYDAVLLEAHRLHMKNVLYQQLSAETYYRPHFFEKDHPFE